MAELCRGQYLQTLPFTGGEEAGRQSRRLKRTGPPLQIHTDRPGRPGQQQLAAAVADADVAMAWSQAGSLSGRAMQRHRLRLDRQHHAQPLAQQGTAADVPLLHRRR